MLTPSRICMDVCPVHSSRWRCSPLKSGHYFYGPSFLFVFDVCGVALRAHHPHTDVDPASHRVRLWRGGSASKVLLHRLFFRRCAFTDALKYVMAPDSSYGAEGNGGTAPLAVTGLSVTQCLVCLFLVSYCFLLKDVFNNLPSRAAALAAGAPHGQLRLRYAAWVEWVASERKTPTEEYVATAGGYWGPPAHWAGRCASSSLRIGLFSRWPELVVFLALCHGISSLYASVHVVCGVARLGCDASSALSRFQRQSGDSHTNLLFDR